MKSNTISVIIPTRVRNKQLLHDCLDSLLQQSVVPSELILIDSSPKGKGRAMARDIIQQKKIMINYVPMNPALGVASARNHGVEKASGSILAFIDDDCIVSPNWIEEGVYMLDQYPGYAVTGKSVNGWKDNTAAVVTHIIDELFFEGVRYEQNQVTYSLFLDTKNLLLPKALIHKHRVPFDTMFDRYSFHEDIDLSLRLIDKNNRFLYHSAMRVTHFGVWGFFACLKREIRKGKSYFHFKNKWNHSKPGIMMAMHVIQPQGFIERQKDIMARIIQLLGSKAILGIVFFWIFRSASYISYYYELMMTILHGNTSKAD